MVSVGAMFGRRERASCQARFESCLAVYSAAAVCSLVCEGPFVARFKQA